MLSRFLKPALAGALLLTLAQPAFADDIKASIKAGLEAYEDGDIKAAKEEIDFAQQLLAQMRLKELQAHLPAALEGWTRQEDKRRGGGGLGVLGGGQSVNATYRRGRERIQVQIMANNQMVATFAAMFANPAMMGSMGTVKRIGRQKVVITKRGDVQTLIDNRILVQVQGRAEVEDKEAFFKAINIRKLKKF